MPTVEPAAPIHRDHETPWAMQLVVCQTNNPGRTQILEACAQAVVNWCAEARNRAEEGDPSWLQAQKMWEKGLIRKHVRRASGARWERANQYEGLTIRWEETLVRAYVPGPITEIDPYLRKLRLEGTEPDDPGKRHHWEPEGPQEVLICAVSPDPYLPLGKAAAAAAHVGHLAWMAAGYNRRAQVQDEGWEIRVIQPDTKGFDEALATARWREKTGQGYVVVDAGFTVVEPGTTTAVGWWATTL